MSEKAAAAPKETKEKTLVFNDQILENLRQNHLYRSAVPGKSHNSPITGAPTRWQKKDGEGIVYDPLFRLTGTLDQVRAALQASRVPEDRIREALAGAYTKVGASTEGEMRDRFRAELAASRNDDDHAARTLGVSWVDLKPFICANKSDLTKKSVAPAKPKPAAKAKAKATQAAKPRKVKTAEDVRKELLADPAAASVLLFSGGKFKKTRCDQISVYSFYLCKEQRVAVGTPEDLAAAKAALNFGTFDIGAAFAAWQKSNEPKPVASTSAAISTSAAPSPAAEPPKRKTSPVRSQPAKALPSPAAASSTAPPAATARGGRRAAGGN